MRMLIESMAEVAEFMSRFERILFRIVSCRSAGVAPLKPISSTAFYCCGVRMEDAASRAPVCGDPYAKRFMDEAALRVFEPFRQFKYPNAANVTCHRIVDDLLRARLVRDPNASVVLIGCGFDSRAYRLQGGHWFEVDEPAVISYKSERLPIGECPNAVDFETESLETKLAALTTARSVLVVVEGDSCTSGRSNAASSFGRYAASGPCMPLCAT